MSRTPRLVVTAQRLFVPTVIAALLAIPVLAGPSDSPTARPLPVHTTANTVLDTVRANAERQHSTLVDEDIRLLALVRNVRPGSGPYVQTRDGVETLVLTARGLPYTLADLRESGAVVTLPTRDLLLTRSVFVAPGARLIIDAPGRTLRLRSEASGFVSLVAWKSDLVLRGSEGSRLGVSSWDPNNERPDTDVVDGRAYIREVSGDMRIAYVNASHLGFWAGRTSGVAWTGSTRDAATGSIVGSTFRASHYGVFVSGGDRLKITDTAFASNAVDGLSLHRNTTGATIRSATAAGNRRHGFSADRGSESVTFAQVTAAQNGGHGIFFNGTPLSLAQSAGGASLRTFGGVDIVGGLLRGNGRAGLRVVEGHGVEVRGTRVADNRDGIVLVNTAAPTTIEGALITGKQRQGISVTGGSADVRDNRVTGAETGIRIRDAAVTVTGNDIARVTSHGVSVIGAATATVAANDISGRGPSGLDTFRLDPDQAVELSANDVASWTLDRDDREYWSTFVPNHPMLLLWVILLGLPLACAVGRRDRQVPIGTLPYRDDLRRDRPGSLLLTSAPVSSGRKS